MRKRWSPIAVLKIRWLPVLSSITFEGADFFHKNINARAIVGFFCTVMTGALMSGVFQRICDSEGVHRIGFLIGTGASGNLWSIAIFMISYRLGKGFVPLLSAGNNPATVRVSAGHSVIDALIIRQIYLLNIATAKNPVVQLKSSCR